MPDVIVGGPAGLSAALFTAKNSLDTVVFDDGTWLHTAHLFTSLGVGSQDGPAFIETARADGDSFGAERRQDEPVTDVATPDDAVELFGSEYLDPPPRYRVESDTTEPRNGPLEPHVAS